MTREEDKHVRLHPARNCRLERTARNALGSLPLVWTSTTVRHLAHDFVGSSIPAKVPTDRPRTAFWANVSGP